MYAYARLLLPVLLVIETGPRYHVRDQRSSFEEDRTKTLVAIVDEMKY